MVDDSVIENVLLSSAENLSGKVEQLINLAKSSGGKDNITVALCEIVQ
jgi:serine/threonine protein phosphatase PrpC